ncbi:Uncharacterised protein [Mycobacteroides abscessus]|nr:Uncharacterised protein [Mycobacteroides abscessus]
MTVFHTPRWRAPAGVLAVFCSRPHARSEIVAR